MKTNTRAEAGAQYAVAAQAYLDAWAELYAHDHATNAEGHFREHPVVAPHPEFLRDGQRLGGHLADAARVRAAEIMAADQLP